MSVLYLLLPFALFLGLAFLVGFLRMVCQGQYDDLETPAHRMLLDDEVVRTNGEVVKTNDEVGKISLPI